MTPTTQRRARRPRPPSDPRAQAEALGYDTGSQAIPVVVDDVAVGTRATIKRASRADPLARIEGVTAGMRTAAQRLARYHEHMSAGMGAGPPDASVERVQEARPGEAAGVRLLAQERAYTAAVMFTRGEEAIGMAAIGVVRWVVLEAKPLLAYDARMRWREGWGKALLLPALERLAREYGCA